MIVSAGRLTVVSTLFASLLCVVPAVSAAQGFAVPPAMPQIRQRIDETALTALSGSVHPLAKAQYDEGAVPDSTPASRMLLVLRRPAATEAALHAFIEDIHNPASPNFHHWLKPEELGTKFGPADADVAQVSRWLGTHGFAVDRVHPGKTVIEFTGTTGQLRQAFHTEIHHYMVQGVLHAANNSEVQIPTALTPVIAGFASLNDFHAKPDLKVKGTALYSPVSKAVKPLWTDPAAGGGVYLALAPGDFNVQYDVGTTYTGAGTTIGIIGSSNVDVGLVNAYRSTFGLPASPLQVVVDGADPGQNGADVESYLDVEAAGSVAPGATVVLYTSAGTVLTDGLYTAALRAVNDDTADTLSMSYGECEVDLGSSTNQFFYQLWQQAAAQGQTVMVSAGDGGAAGCDNFDSSAVANFGLAVSGFASTPYNVAVGGTDFYYSAYNQGNTALNNQIFSYWNGASSKTPVTSLLKTIPEQPWNEPFGLNAGGSPGIGIVAGSGGASSCSSETSGYVCLGGYAKPSWQSGITGVPADGVRDLPDVSLFASSGSNYSFWPICATAGDCTTVDPSTGAVNITGVGGTSASSPAFAGVMALVDQAMKSRQGQADYVLYPLAAQQPAVFHDVTVGSNKVPCMFGSLDVGCAFDSTVGGYDLGFAATVGYDRASGLGSVDVSKLIANWNSVTFKGTSTTVSLSATSVAHGLPVTVKSTVTPSSGSGTPSGAVALTAKVSGATTQVGLGSLTLTGGAVTSSVTSLPGGTYSVYANYGGDGVYAASQSAASTLTVTPEASVISYPALELKAYNGKVLGYGQAMALLAQVVAYSGAANGTPTGYVTFTDSNGGGTWQAVVNQAGVAEWDPAGLAIGSHTITATYAGDASFLATTTPAVMTFTIGKGTPYVAATPAMTVVPAGGSLTVAVGVSNPYLGDTTISVAAPSGTVTVTLGSLTQVVTLTAASQSGYGTATFPNLAAGSYNLLATYSGDANWATATSGNVQIISVVAGDSFVPTTTTLTASPSTLTGANGQVLAMATVVGNGLRLPGGYVNFLIGGQLFAQSGLAASGTNGIAGVYIPGYYFPNGAASLVAVYSGDGYFSGSISGPATLTVNAADFGLTAVNPTLTIASGSKGTANLSLVSSGMTGAVTISCTTSTTAIVCTPPASFPTLTATGQASTSVVITAANVAANVTPKIGGSSYYRGGIVMACLLMLVIPRKRRGRALILGVLLGVASFAMGCSGSSSNAGTGPVTTVKAPASTYNVLVTAVAGGVTHTARLTVDVQ